MTEHKEPIERALHDLAAEPVQAGDEFKQRLIVTLRQEQYNILQARTSRRQRLSDSFSHWAHTRWSRPVVRWALVAAVLILALVGIPWTSQHLWTSRSHPLLTIHQGEAQISSQQPSAPESLQTQGDAISIVEGTRIILNEDSTASLLLFNDSKVELLAGTQLTLTKAQPRSIWQAQTIQMQVTTGQVQVQVSPLRSSDERFEVDLPAALISVHGTVFRAHVVSPQHTYIATDEGIVSVTLHDSSQGNPQVNVPAGYQVDAIIGQPLQVRPQETPDGEIGAAVMPLPSLQAPQAQTEITRSPVLSASVTVTVTPAFTSITTATTPSAITAIVPTTETVISGTIITGTLPVTLTGAFTPSHHSTPTIPLAADLELVQTDTPNPTAAEGTLTYTLIVANHGPSDAQDVVVRDILPAQVRLIDSTLAMIEEENGQTVTATVGWKLGTLAAGDERVIQTVVTVHSWVTQSFTNTATVTATTLDDNPHNNQATVQTALTDAADLTISATIPMIVGSGNVVTCTLAYANLGPAAAYSVTIIEQLATGMLFGGVVSAELEPPPTAAAMGIPMLEEQSPATWLAPKLAAGTSGYIIFTATVQPDVIGPLTNTAIIASASPDNNWSNNDHDQATFVTPVANVTTAQSVTPNPVVVGDVLTYTLAYTNYGPWAAENVFITATLPPSITLSEQTSSDLAALAQIERSFTWFTPSLPSGASGTVVLTMIVDRHATGPLHSHAIIRSATPDGNPDDDTSAGSIDVLTPALSLAQTVQPDVVAPRQPCTYTLYVTNTGAVTFAAQSLALVEILPPGFYPTATTATQPIMLPQMWAWRNPAPLSPGESLSVSLLVSATENVLPGLYLGAAKATATIPIRQAQDRPGGTITATAPISVRLALPSVTMAQQVTGYGTDVAASDLVTFTIHLTNTGPSPFASVPLTMHYGAQALIFVGADPIPSQAPVDGTIDWSNLLQPPPHGIGHDLLPGKAMTVTLTFVTWPLTGVGPVESHVTIGQLRDVYDNLADGYISEKSVYRVRPLYLPLVVRSS